MAYASKHAKALFPSLQHLKHKQADAAATETVPTFTATPKQVVWINAVLSGLYKFMAIGGGIRGTKSFACISAIILLCRIYPRSRWAIVRRDIPTIRRNVLPTIDKLRVMSGGFVGPLNYSNWTYTCANGSQIILFAEQFERDPELDRWKGLEVNGFDLEEGNELNEKSANKAIERAGAYIIPATTEDPSPRQPPPLIMVNFNPCNEWPRHWFYEPWKAGTIKPPYYFLPATIFDNPYASDDYKESLKHMPKEEYNRYVMGEWDFIDNPRQLIKSEWLWAARNVEFVDGPVRIGADIARHGDDHTTIYKVRGNNLRKATTIAKFDNMAVANVLLNDANAQHEPVKFGKDVRVDVVGLGSGVVDYCRKQGLDVYEVVSGAAPIERPGAFFRFKNLRSQMWWECREKFRNGELSLYMTDAAGNEVPLPPRLISDLTAPMYEISGDKVIEVEPKEVPTTRAQSTNATWGIKNRLGRSPDDGDAFVMAVFDFPPPHRRPILPGTVQIVGH